MMMMDPTDCLPAPDCQPIESSSDDDSQISLERLLRAPLEELLVPSDDSDDESSISSISTDGETKEDDTPQEEACSKQPRSLFQSYWKKDGKPSAPPPRPSSPHCVTRLMEQDDEDQSMNTYERTLKSCEVIVVKKRSPYESLPLWMGWFTASAPSLMGNRGLSISDCARASKSDSALHKPPLKSLLRAGRFSGHHPPTAASHHVHFRPVVQMYLFEPPQESWAPEGWSSWFR